MDVHIRAQEAFMKNSFIQRIKHGLLRLRLHPIRVFVFHQVSDEFEPDTMWECDWTQTDLFKQNILALMKDYSFISLDEVRDHLTKDKLRLRNYAALTTDDGWASLHGILPWLIEKKIPVTLFLNPSCLDGQHWNSRETDKLLTKEEVERLVQDGSPLITVASHGWTHRNCKTMTMKEFVESVVRSEEVLQGMPGKTSFYAFASGRHTSDQDAFLRGKGLVPVFVDGRENYCDPVSIHRECIDGIVI